MSIVPEHIRAAAIADAPIAPSIEKGDGASTDAPIAPAGPVDYHAEAADLIEFAWATFEPLYPSLATVYTDDRRRKIAAAAAPVMAKYDFSIGRFGPELLLVIAVWPCVIPTIKAIRHDQAQRKNQVAAAEQPKAESAARAPAAEVPAGGSTAAAAAGRDLDRFAHGFELEQAR